jgi:hypothetical protein
MLTQAWMNGIAIAVVGAGLVNAWLAVRSPTKRAAKPKESSRQESSQPESSEHALEAQALPDPERTIHTRESLRWAVLRNEEEIRRRQARSSDTKTDSSS